MAFSYIKNILEDRFIKSTFNKNENTDEFKDFINDISESKILKNLYYLYQNINKPLLENSDDNFIMAYVSELVNEFKQHHSESDIKKVVKQLCENYNIPQPKELNGLDYIIMNPKNTATFHKYYVSLQEVKENIKNKQANETTLTERVNMPLSVLNQTIVRKLNEKYSETLNENEIVVLKNIIGGNKQEMYQTLRENTVSAIKTMIAETQDEELIEELEMAKTKIIESSFKPETFFEDYIELYNLKNDLG